MSISCIDRLDNNLTNKPVSPYASIKGLRFLLRSNRFVFDATNTKFTRFCKRNLDRKVIFLIPGSIPFNGHKYNILFFMDHLNVAVPFKATAICLTSVEKAWL